MLQREYSSRIRLLILAGFAKYLENPLFPTNSEISLETFSSHSHGKTDAGIPRIQWMVPELA